MSHSEHNHNLPPRDHPSTTRHIKEYVETNQNILTNSLDSSLCLKLSSDTTESLCSESPSSVKTPSDVSSLNEKLQIKLKEATKRRIEEQHAQARAKLLLSKESVARRRLDRFEELKHAAKHARYNMQRHVGDFMQTEGLAKHYEMANGWAGRGFVSVKSPPSCPPIYWCPARPNQQYTDKLALQTQSRGEHLREMGDAASRSVLLWEHSNTDDNDNDDHSHRNNNIADDKTKAEADGKDDGGGKDNGVGCDAVH